MNFLQTLILGRQGNNQPLHPLLRGQEEDGASRRALPVKAVSTSLTSQMWELEFYSHDAIGNLMDAISTLQETVVEPNLFFRAEAVQAMVDRVLPDDTRFLCLWETEGKDKLLRFFMPVTEHSIGLPRKPALCGLVTDFGPIGVPLVHSDDPETTIDILLELLASKQSKTPSLLVMPFMQLKGPVAELFAAAAARHNLEIGETHNRERPVMKPGTDDENYFDRVLGKQTRTELSELFNAFNENGPSEFVVADRLPQIHAAFEEFLLLESKSWRGRLNEDLFSYKKLTAFARETVSEMAQRGMCEIYTLRQNGMVAAMLVTFIDQGRRYAWRLTWDENQDQYKLGTQLIMWVSERLVRLSSKEKGINDVVNETLIDSLAFSDHPIGELWQERQDIGTLMINVKHIAAGDLPDMQKAIERSRKIKSMLRKMHNPLVRKKAL